MFYSLMRSFFSYIHSFLSLHGECFDLSTRQLATHDLGSLQGNVYPREYSKFGVFLYCTMGTVKKESHQNFVKVRRLRNSEWKGKYSSIKVPRLCFSDGEAEYTLKYTFVTYFEGTEKKNVNNCGERCVVLHKRNSGDRK